MGQCSRLVQFAIDMTTYIDDFLPEPAVGGLPSAFGRAYVPSDSWAIVRFFIQRLQVVRCICAFVLRHVQLLPDK